MRCLLALKLKEGMEPEEEPQAPDLWSSLEIEWSEQSPLKKKVRDAPETQTKQGQLQPDQTEVCPENVNVRKEKVLKTRTVEPLVLTVRGWNRRELRRKTTKEILGTWSGRLKGHPEEERKKSGGPGLRSEQKPTWRCQEVHRRSSGTDSWVW